MIMNIMKRIKKARDTKLRQRANFDCLASASATMTFQINQSTLRLHPRKQKEGCKEWKDTRLGHHVVGKR